MMGNYTQNTGFLFADPSFVQGFASAMDIGGTLCEYNASNTSREADARAIANDWAITGKDIVDAIKNIEKE
jgi:hypothetical protein